MFYLYFLSTVEVLFSGIVKEVVPNKMLGFN